MESIDAKDKDSLRSLHTTAKGLHKHGFITKRRMKFYDELCLEPIPDYTKERIRDLRKHLRISQSVMAALINTSSSTVQQWEAGCKKPGGPSSKLLSLLERKGLEALV